jgi:glycosyltransferase involved in cell wall biosynthesis
MTQNPPKKFDMLIHELNHSGVSNAAITLANEVVANNIPMRIIVVGEKCALPFPLNEKIDLKFLGIPRGNNFVEKLFYAIRVYFILSVYLARCKCRNLFVWGKEFTALAAFMRMSLPLPYNLIGVNTTSISNHLQNAKRPILRIFLNWVYKTFLNKADFIIAQSYGMVEELKSVYNVTESKITVIYPPLQAKFFATPMQRNKTNKILYVGRLAKGKGLFRMLEILLNMQNKNASLQIIGDGELENPLKDKVRELGLEGRISFAGRQNDVLPYLQNSDALILTSEYEGFGMVLAEAIACGVPVVAFDCPSGPSEIIKNGINGYLIPEEDIEYFSRKLDEVLARNWDVQTIAETASKFNPDTVIKRYLQVIGQIFI